MQNEKFATTNFQRQAVGSHLRRFIDGIRDGLRPNPNRRHELRFQVGPVYEHE